MGAEHAVWRNDPRGFTECVLGQGLWSKQRAILDSVGRNKRTAVPSCFGVGKTLAAAAATCHHVCVYPPGTALAITTATRFRQVKRQMWPEIRKLANRAGLPGQVDTTQWKMTTGAGVETVVAYGFSAPPNDEAATHGIHAPHILLVVDEAGGIGKPLGRGMRGILAGEGAKGVFIGNPATDDEDTWFENLCDSADVSLVRIGVPDTPHWTGERTPRCYACPPTVRPHPVATHLVDKEWERGVVLDYGKDSPYYQSKALGRFPKGGADRAIPSTWLEEAADLGVQGNGLPNISRDLLGNYYAWQPAPGSWIRLGVDVASDGGDELAISRCEGDVARVRKYRAGADNYNSVNVAGYILEEIREAEQLRQLLGTSYPVRVKIDAIGVGWGVCGILETWAAEGVHNAEIVRVIVSEKPHPRNAADDSTLRPKIKRDEMWLAMRALLQPDEDGQQGIALDIDDHTRAQLASPKSSTNATTGMTTIESKKSLKGRGLRSPDRGESVLLSVYEPLPLRRRDRIIAGA
jgi:hypothetical protein